jgi:hypothetical protein
MDKEEAQLIIKMLVDAWGNQMNNLIDEILESNDPEIINYIRTIIKSGLDKMEKPNDQ